MKKLVLLFCMLGISAIFFAQRQKKCMKTKEIKFCKEKYLFYSEHNNGAKDRSFSILTNQEQLNKLLNTNKLYTKSEEIMGNSMKFPKNQKVVLYNFGEQSSGIYQPKGIERLKIVNDTLEVYLIRKSLEDLISDEFSSNPIKEQVVTRPRMFFSIPENLEFKSIIIK